MPTNRLKDNIPPWLYSTTLGKYNPAALQASDVLSEPLRKKTIILDSVVFFCTRNNAIDDAEEASSLDKYSSFKNMLTALIELNFDIYLWGNNRAYKVDCIDTTVFDDLTDASITSFNSSTMWEFLFDEHELSRKNCVPLGLSGNASANDFLHLCTLVDISGGTLLKQSTFFIYASHAVLVGALPLFFGDRYSVYFRVALTIFSFGFVRASNRLEAMLQYAMFHPECGITDLVDECWKAMQCEDQKVGLYGDQTLKCFSILHHTLSSHDYPGRERDLDRLPDIAFSLIKKNQNTIVDFVNIKPPIFKGSVPEKSQYIYNRLFQQDLYEAVASLHDEAVDSSSDVSILPVHDAHTPTNAYQKFFMDLLPGGEASIKAAVLKFIPADDVKREAIESCDDSIVNYVCCATEFSENDDFQAYSDNVESKKLFTAVCAGGAALEWVVDAVPYKVYLVICASKNIENKQVIQNFTDSMNALAGLYMGLANNHEEVPGFHYDFSKIGRFLQIYISKFESMRSVPSSAPQKGSMYGGQHLSEQLAAVTSDNVVPTVQRISYFKCKQKGRLIDVPPWLSNLARMAVGQIFEKNNEQPLALKNDGVLTRLNVKGLSTDHYQLTLNTRHLRGMKLPDGDYLIPITHPELMLIQCENATVYPDAFGRYLLRCESLDQCRVAFSIPLQEPEHIFNFKSDYLDVTLKIPQEIREILQGFFSKKHDESCAERAQALMSSHAVASYCYYIQNTTHAFLMLKDAPHYLIDLGGSAVNSVYVHESISTSYSGKKAPDEEKVVPDEEKVVIVAPSQEVLVQRKITTFQVGSLWQQYYDKCLQAYEKQLNEVLKPKKNQQCTEQVFTAGVLRQTGVHCIISPITDSLQVLCEIGRQSFEYHIDGSELLTKKDQLDADIAHVVNLSPWHIPDRGSRDRWRVRLHESLIELAQTHCIILLTDDAGSVFEDKSFESRISGIYKAAPLAITLESACKSSALEDIVSPLPLQLPAILKAIKEQLDQGNHQVSLFVLYAAEDQLRWSRLEEVIRQIELTGAMVIDGCSYQSKVTQCKIRLDRIEVDIKPLLKDIICTSDEGNNLMPYLLNPHMAQHWLMKYMAIHEGQIIHCHLVEALSICAWYELLTQAKVSGCQFILSSVQAGYLPDGYGEELKPCLVDSEGAVTISNNPSVTAGNKKNQHRDEAELMSVDNLSGARDLLFSDDPTQCGKVAKWLVEGKRVILYAQSTLDEAGDLQQLLAPLLQGSLIGLNGEYCRFEAGRFELVVDCNDQKTICYFSWLKQDEVNEASLVVIASNKDEYAIQRENQIQVGRAVEAPFPELQSENWAIPVDVMLPSRYESIEMLWQFLQTVNTYKNHLSSLLIAGPSALSKTSLVKQFLTQMGYQIIEKNNLDAVGGNVCRVFKHDERFLENYLQHAKEHGQVILIDEIDSLPLAAQQLIVEALTNDCMSNGFAVIGTLNQAYYPGRESCLPALKNVSQQIALQSYTREECIPILKQKLSTVRVGGGTLLPEAVVGDLVTVVKDSFPLGDAVVRLFVNSLTTLSPAINKAYAAWLEMECAKNNVDEHEQQSLFIEGDDGAQVIRVTGDTDLTDVCLNADDVHRLYKAGVRNFRHTNLSAVIFDNMELSGADFSGANLQGVCFNKVSVETDVVLTDATLSLGQIMQLAQAGQKYFQNINILPLLREQECFKGAAENVIQLLGPTLSDPLMTKLIHLCMDSGENVFKIYQGLKSSHPGAYQMARAKHEKEFLKAFETIYQALPSGCWSGNFMKKLGGESDAEKFKVIRAIKYDKGASKQAKQAYRLANALVKGDMTKQQVFSAVYMETYLASSIVFRRSSILKSIKSCFFGYSSKISQYKNSMFHQSGVSLRQDADGGIYDLHKDASMNFSENTRSWKVQQKLSDLCVGSRPSRSDP